MGITMMDSARPSRRTTQCVIVLDRSPILERQKSSGHNFRHSSTISHRRSWIDSLLINNGGGPMDNDGGEARKRKS